MTFHANGKLLLTAEYFILDGAKALALPTKLGQSLTIEHQNDAFFWQSKGHEGDIWFSGQLKLDGLVFQSFKGDSSHISSILEGLERLFQAINRLNPNFWEGQNGKLATTHLEFPRNWGLGSSSTLIHLLAKWAEVDPFALSDATFGGSGYDVACAGVNQPIFYQRKENKPTFEEIDFKPLFSENLYFVFLNQKQNSREGIARYRQKSQNLPPQYFDDISSLTELFYRTNNLTDFEKIIVEHENCVASVIELERAKTLYFNDFWGEIKSLGAWGGDFVLATSTRSADDTRHYFKSKGFTTVLTYAEMIR